MAQGSTLFIGLDVHKETIAVAIIYLTHRCPRVSTKPPENARQPLPQSRRAEAKTC